VRGGVAEFSSKKISVTGYFEIIYKSPITSDVTGLFVACFVNSFIIFRK